jgi:hypothetical protein
VSEWGQLTGGTNSSICQFVHDMADKRQNVAAYRNKDLIAYIVFVLHFAAVVTLLVQKTSSYCQ